MPLPEVVDFGRCISEVPGKQNPSDEIPDNSSIHLIRALQFSTLSASLPF